MLTTSSTFSTRRSASLEMWTMPSLPGASSTKGAELEDADHLAVVELTHLGHKDDGLDDLLGGVAALGILAGNVDGAVVLDVDLEAGVGWIFWMTLPPDR